MGLREICTAAATSRAHVLVAEAPGAFRVRVALERAVQAAGWSVAESVADADVLAVVGQPGPELLAVIDHAWRQMSEPRARIEVRDEADVASALVEARRALQATNEQRARASERPASPGPSAPEQDTSHGHESHEDGGHGHDGHDHDDAGGGHDHGQMSPDGIPLAEGAEDRDGLEMDELHLPLGPVLAHWPAGVVVQLTLHGDVVAGAEVEHLGGDPGERGGSARDDGAAGAARLLDAAASVLALTGLPAEAARARRLRDSCLDAAPVDGEAITVLGRRIRRQRVLRWLLRGLALTDEDGRGEELYDRLVGLVDRARTAVDADPTSAHRAGPALEALPELLRGRELAAVRLWMAALGADLTRTALEEPSHG